MVRSKEELLQTASAWVNQAKSDIRNQIVNFLRISGINEEQLADILAMTPAELHSIITTNNEISLSSFAKLLVATDNVLEIKPLAESPLANSTQQQPRDSHGRFAPRSGAQSAPRASRTQRTPSAMSMPNADGGIAIDRDGYPVNPRTCKRIPNMPRVPMDRNGRPMPPMGGFPMPNGEMPQAPFMGGMPGMERRRQAVAPQPMPQMPMPQMEAPQPMPQMVGGNQPVDELASKSRAELVQIIQDNFWDGEINCEEVAKAELVDFLMTKRAANVQAPQAQAAPADASMEQFKGMLETMAAQHPELAETIAQYMPKQ